MESLAIAFVLNCKQDQLQSLSSEMVSERECLQKDITLLQERYSETLENY